MKAERIMLSVMSAWLLATPQVISAHPPTMLAQFRGEEQTSIDVYEKASPSVVTIKAGRSSGSGSIIAAEGLVLTNEHVVRDSRSGQVLVKTAEGRDYMGQVIATDRKNDLALVRLNTNQRLRRIKLADPNNIRVGQQVYAIGSPFGLEGTLTTGILSRIDSKDGDLQTDAALNQGNSGGPLLNSQGQLIGVNKSIISSSREGGNIGIGFATSVRVARDFIARHAGTGGYNNPPDRRRPYEPEYEPAGDRPRMGVTVNQRMMVLQVDRGSPAERAGLMDGDRLVGINGQRVRNIDDVRSFLNRCPRSIVLIYIRNGSRARTQVNF
ncbi:MAG: trypsin-like peptidase domain-containing protein [Hormoscilla sp. GM7CHS1pb]|nr:trypsin-like peptidase domain-containing protein [Hormoscilla sp. GM7CHS1pb]